MALKKKSDVALKQSNRPREDPSQKGTLPSEKRPAKPKTVWHDLGALGVKIVVIALIGVALFTLVYGLHYNLEPGMNPTVKDGDLVIFYRWDKDYRAGDLVVLEHEGESQVRRVIAVTGDTVDITERGVVINGSLQQEREIFFETSRYAEGISFPVTLMEGEVFVLGDARINVTDSRIYGPIQAEDTKGQVFTILKRRNL